jgi:hypothetical protein
LLPLKINRPFSNFAEKNGKSSSSLYDWINRIKEEEEKKFLQIIFGDSLIELNEFQTREFKRIISEYTTDDSLFQKIVDRIKEVSRSLNLSKIGLVYTELLNQKFKKKDVESCFNVLFKGINKIKAIIPEGTIAEENYNVFMKSSHYQSVEVIFVNGEQWNTWLPDIDSYINPFINRNSAGNTFSRTLLFLAWEPLVFYFKEKVRELKPSFRLNTFNIAHEYMRVYPGNFYFNFDLIMKKTNKWTYNSRLGKFLYGVSLSIKQLNESINEIRIAEFDMESARGLIEGQAFNNDFISKENYFNYLIKENKELRLLSNTLNLPPLDCYQSIKNLKFSLDIDFKWINDYLFSSN